MSDTKYLEDPNLDKVEEYFRQKDVARTLRNDLKDLQLQFPETEELSKLLKRVKEIREKINDDDSIKALKEKLATTKERMDLLKELIRIELLEKAQDEVKRNGRKLKLVNNIKEFRDDGEKPRRKFFNKNNNFR